MTGAKPWFMAAVRPFITLSKPLRLVINWKRAGLRVSRLILIASNPACFKASSLLASTIPLVVSPIVFRVFEDDVSSDDFNLFISPR